MGIVMRSFYSGLAMVLILMVPFAGVAETGDLIVAQNDTTNSKGVTEATDVASNKEQLSTITIEGRYQRQGTVELQPGSGGTLDTSELLKRVPGANVNRNGPLTNLPQYRGLSGNQINVMVDGVNLKEVGPNSMDTSLSNIPKAVVKSVKVYRGIAPVSSGIETLGGTIATESKKGEFAEPGKIETHGVASAGYSWVNSGRYAGINASVANENHRAFFNGTYEKGRDYNFGVGKPVSDSQYERSTWGVGYGFNMDDQEIGISYDHKNTVNSGTPSLPLDIRYIRGDVGNINYSGEFGNGYKVDAKGFFQTSDHQMDNYRLRPVPRPGGAPRFRFVDNNVTAGGYRAALTIPDILSGDLSIGADGDLANHNSIVRDPTAAGFFIRNFNDAQRDRYGFFAEWDAHFADVWNVELGLRYNHIEMDAGPVSTSIGAPAAQLLATRFNSANRSVANNNVDGVAVLRYAATDDLDLEFGFGSKTRAPSYQQRYLWIPLETTGGLADGRVYVGDINLKSERSYEVEFSLDWHTERFYLTPSVYYRYVNNYIQGLAVTDIPTRMVAGAIQPGGPGPLRFSNINANLWGTDMEVGFSVTDYLRFDGIISYVRGRRVGTGADNLYRIAPLNGRLKMTYERGDWMAFTEYVGAAKQSSTSSFNGERPTPGYGLFNVRVQYQPNYAYVNGLTVAAGVDNILDKSYADHLNGINRVIGSDVALGSRVPNPGRNVYLTASYDW